MLAILVGCLGLSPVAQARDWRALAGSSGDPVYTDGARFAVQLVDTQLVVREDQAPSRRRVIDLSAHCTQINGVAVGSGRAAVMCGSAPAADRGAAVLLVDLSTEVVTLAPITSTAITQGFFELQAVGFRWIRGTFSGTGRGATALYFDTSTGTQRSAFDASVTQDYDLDSPQLIKPLCAPVRRPQDRAFRTDPSATGRADVAVDGRWVVFDGASRPGGDAPFTQLTPSAWRCGSSRPIKLGPPCRPGLHLCPPVQAGSGLVTFARGSRVKLVDLRRASRTRTLAGPRKGSAIAVHHTTSRLWSIAQGSDRLYVRPVR